MTNNSYIFIPTRLESSRLKEKALLEINGVSIIRTAYEAVVKTTDIPVVICTPNKELVALCADFTDVVHVVPPKGPISDCATAAKDLQDNDNILIVQGDELIIPDGLMDSIKDKLKRYDIVTVVKPIPLNQDEITTLKNADNGSALSQCTCLNTNEKISNRNCVTCGCSLS